MPLNTVPSTEHIARRAPSAAMPLAAGGASDAVMRRARAKTVEAVLKGFADAKEEADQTLKDKGHGVAYEITDVVQKLHDGTIRASFALDAAIKLLPDDTDADNARAVLELVSQSMREISNGVWSVAGFTCVLLTNGAQTEPCHE